MRLFLTEKLASSVLSSYSRLIQLADFCWALKVENGAAAVPVLEDGRWQTGDAPLIEVLERRLAIWASRLAMHQRVEGRALRFTEQALLAYGLWARLWAASFGIGLVRHSALMSGTSLEELDLDVVGDDPYLRDAFAHKTGIRTEVRAVRLHTARPSLPLRQRVRERLVGNAWLRAMSLRCNLRKVDLSSWSKKSHAERNPKTAAVFILNQRFMDVFSPVLHELESRGWRVLCFHYGALTRPPTDAVAFADAAGGARLLMQDKPRWSVNGELLQEGLVSPSWLVVALNASWVTASVQVARHRYVLESWRPDVVVFFGPETMSLSLQCAAESLGIPSLYMAHGFLGPLHSPPGYFTATASALCGSACVDANTKGPDGTTRHGLIATGYPPYDALVKDSGNMGQQRRPLANLEVPVERPYLVLVFGTWALYPLWCSLQRKTLKMVIDALPDDAFLICKLHPSCEEREMCVALLGEGLPCDAFRVVGEDEYSTPDLLAACDVAVANEVSMALRDALVMGRPAIAIRDPAFPHGQESCNPLNHPGSDFKDTCRLVSNTDELRKALFVLTRDECARNDLLRHRKAYIEQFLFASDGRSSQRVADLVEHLGEGKDTDSFIPAVGKSLL